MIKWILFSFFILLYSCKGSTTSQVLNEKKMQEVLWDVYRADALSRNISKYDSSRSIHAIANDLTQKVFRVHNISADQFKISYTYYTNHPVILKKLLDSIYAIEIKQDTLQLPLKNKKLLLDSTHK